jgi:ApaG protein
MKETVKEKEIEIQVTTKMQYLIDQSSPETQRFLWSYDITILNTSDEIIQLLNRYWKITDMRGKVEEVRGPGVIGLQPIIKPGKEFAYSSYCQLTTPQGTMEGSYEIQTLDEKHYLIDIPKFVLTSPSSGTNAFRSRLH